MLHASNGQGICWTQRLVFRLFQVIQINYGPIHKNQLSGHFCGITAYTGGKKRDYTCTALTFQFGSSPTESGEPAASVVSTATSLTLHLQSTGTQPNVLFVGGWARKHTGWCGRGVCTMHPAVREDAVTSLRRRMVNSCRGATRWTNSQSSCCAGSVFSVQASVLIFRG